MLTHSFDSLPLRWLIDFAKSGHTSIYLDAVKVVSVLLFEHYPLPWKLAELKQASKQKLIDALGVKEAAADRLLACMNQCSSMSQLRSKLEADEDLSVLLPLVADDAKAEKCAIEACEVETVKRLEELVTIDGSGARGDDDGNTADENARDVTLHLLLALAVALVPAIENGNQSAIKPRLLHK